MTEYKTELQRNAISGARQKELNTYQRALDMNWMDRRMENSKMGQIIAPVNQEAAKDKEFQEKTNRAALVNAKSLQETALAKEISSVRDSEYCTLSRRQYLRENDPELRALVKKLQAGYVCRDLKMQVLANEYRKLQDKVQEQRANNMIHKSYLDTDSKSLQENIVRQFENRQELLQQMARRHSDRETENKVKLTERKVMEDVMKTIQEQDLSELQQKRESRERMKQEMIESELAREEERRRQREASQAEEREREIYLETLHKKTDTGLEEKQRKNQIREENNDKIRNKIIAEQTARLERDDIIKQLQEQELLEAQHEHDLREKETTHIARKETDIVLKMQMKGKIEETKRQREKEHLFRETLQSKVEAEENRERQKDRQSSETRRQYGRELQAQIEGNRRRRQRETEGDNRRAQNVWDCNNAWRLEVEKERDIILKEHLAELEESHCAPLNIQTSVSNDTNTRAKCNAQCRVLREM